MFLFHTQKAGSLSDFVSREFFKVLYIKEINCFDSVLSGRDYVGGEFFVLARDEVELLFQIH